jgi:Acetyltransferases, including N-acetylases of ribosomal proteins
VIETERLFIRPFTGEDIDELLGVWSDPANERFVGARTPQTTEEVLEWFERWLPWGVWERSTGELVGDCGLSFDVGFGASELSYGFRRDRWGRGYATEAALACVRHGFDVMGLERIVADVDPANTSSARVLEKCGFEHVGDVDGKLFFAITAETTC